MKSPSPNSEYPFIQNVLQETGGYPDLRTCKMSLTRQEETEPSVRPHNIMTLLLPTISILSCEIDITYFVPVVELMRRP